jgi:hypothetical protein
VKSRRRAEELRERHDFASEVLTLYLALLDVWERTPDPPFISWAATNILPEVLAATAKAGPPPLAAALPSAVDPSDAEAMLTAWLAGEELIPVERYLARATLRGLDPSPRGDQGCPHCGGPPQLSFRTATGDRLVSGKRGLQCARCTRTWWFTSNTCVYCGQSGGTVYAEQRDGTRVGRAEAGDTLFPHLRVEACGKCQRYLIDVDLGADPRAVPEVDELAALPLDLYATEHGYTKITPNLMGF